MLCGASIVLCEEASFMLCDASFALGRHRSEKYVSYTSCIILL